MYILDALEFHAQMKPQDVAIIHDGGAATFRNLRDSVIGAALRVRALGLDPDRPVGVYVEDSLLHLTVSDDGPGIDPLARPTGSGFGLHSVRERLRVAGPPHALHVDSSPEGGTRIRITLPIHPADAASPSPATGETR